MEFMSQSVPQKNVAVEFHSPHSSLLVVTKCLNWKGTWSYVNCNQCGFSHMQLKVLSHNQALFS